MTQTLRYILRASTLTRNGLPADVAPGGSDRTVGHVEVIQLDGESPIRRDAPPSPKLTHYEDFQAFVQQGVIW
jgi:hypothetical protein